MEDVWKWVCTLIWFETNLISSLGRMVWYLCWQYWSVLWYSDWAIGCLLAVINIYIIHSYQMYFTQIQPHHKVHLSITNMQTVLLVPTLILQDSITVLHRHNITYAKTQSLILALLHSIQFHISTVVYTYNIHIDIHIYHWNSNMLHVLISRIIRNSISIHVNQH